MTTPSISDIGKTAGLIVTEIISEIFSEESTTLKLNNKLLEWRNETQEEGSAIGRRFCYGGALLGLTLLGVLEGVGKIGLAILTSPLLLIGEPLPLKLIVCAADCLVMSAAFITISEIYNAFKPENCSTDKEFYRFN